MTNLPAEAGLIVGRGERRVGDEHQARLEFSGSTNDRPPEHDCGDLSARGGSQPIPEILLGFIWLFGHEVR